MVQFLKIYQFLNLKFPAIIFGCIQWLSNMKRIVIISPFYKNIIRGSQRLQNVMYRAGIKHQGLIRHLYQISSNLPCFWAVCASKKHPCSLHISSNNIFDILLRRLKKRHIQNIIKETDFYWRKNLYNLNHIYYKSISHLCLIVSQFVVFLVITLWIW